MYAFYQPSALRHIKDDKQVTFGLFADRDVEWPICLYDTPLGSYDYLVQTHPELGAPGVVKSTGTSELVLYDAHQPKIITDATFVLKNRRIALKYGLPRRIYRV